MHSLHRRHHHSHLLRRTSVPDGDPQSISLHVLALSPKQPDAAPLLKRSPQGSSTTGSNEQSDQSSATKSSDASSSTCTPGDTSARCEKPTSGNTSILPILLGLLIPLTIAIVVFILLHRRHVRKLRKEDANDKHKSLDFGLTTGGKRSKKAHAPEMSDADGGFGAPGGGHAKGFSLDMGSPYILPPGLHGSRESLHSLSRTIHDGDDRYRPATTFVGNEKSSLHSFPTATSHWAGDESSSFTGSSSGAQDPMSQNLVRNAAGMPRSSPPAPRIPSPEFDGDHGFPIQLPEPVYGASAKDSASSASRSTAQLQPPTTGAPRDAYFDGEGGGVRKSNQYLAALISANDSPAIAGEQARGTGSQGQPNSHVQNAHPSGKPRSPSPPLNDTSISRNAGLRRSMVAPVISLPEEVDPSDDGFSHLDGHDLAGRSFDDSEPAVLRGSTYHGLDAPDFGRGHQRRSMGLRPLPPDDPSDDPEQRANRIRSFYKEYFDESKPAPVQEPRAYREDYGQGYSGHAIHQASDADEFGIPRPQYAQPMTRRAMTPPPRAPPRAHGGPFRHPSMSGFAPRTSRAFSSVSGRHYAGPAGPRTGMRKPAPLPEPLREIPTPSLLKEDAFALPIDFAPPATYQERRVGRPESPLGGMRPYSPSIPAHVPLVSSFDDLSAMPSPHALRKSSTFTALDFAPPPRIKMGDNASDAGSIRSGRSHGSAMSAAHLQSVRAGAYRVSRLPRDVVGTQADLATALRPTWDMRQDV